MSAGKPDRRPAGQVEPRVERRAAGRAQRRPSRPQPDAGGREREVEGAGARAGARAAIGAMMAERRSTRTLTPPHVGRRLPRRSARARSGRRRPSRSASIVPTGSSRTPSAPRTSGTSPIHGPQTRGGPTAPAARRRAPGSGWPEEHRVDREAHEEHVDAVRARQPQPGAGLSAGRPIRPMNLRPQAVGDLDAVAERRCRG